MISALLSLVVIQSISAQPLSGRVIDASGGALTGAVVTVSCGDQTGSAVTDSAGRFRLDSLPPLRCQVVASLDGFLAAQQTADLRGSAAPVLELRLAVRPFSSQILVTPARGVEEDTSRVAQGASLLEQADLQRRPYTIVTQALKEEAGVLAQQTTASQGSPMWSIHKPEPSR